MDAKEYIKELKRMLDSLGRIGGYCNGVACNKCPLYVVSDEDCAGFNLEIVDIVEQWSKEHPRRTYISALLEAYPNTPTNKYGMPIYITCPYALGLEACDERPCLDSDYNCNVCWNREYKEARGK